MRNGSKTCSCCALSIVGEATGQVRGAEAAEGLLTTGDDFRTLRMFVGSFEVAIVKIEEERGSRNARAEAGVEDLELSRHAPANDANITRADLYVAMRWKRRCQSDWIAKYLGCKHAFQNQQEEIDK